MSTSEPIRPRAATAADATRLIELWAKVFDDASSDEWRGAAREWFEKHVADERAARFPVIEIDGAVIATAIGTLELGVPNPQSPRGRAVRLANVYTEPEHRGRGYGTALVQDVVAWARQLGADRVALSASAEGQQLYERAGFTMTAAPRMKLML